VREIDRVARLMLLQKMEIERHFSIPTISNEEYEAIKKEVYGDNFIDPLFGPKNSSISSEDKEQVNENAVDPYKGLSPYDRIKLHTYKEKEFYDKLKKREDSLEYKEEMRKMLNRFNSHRLSFHDQRYVYLDSNAGDRISKRVESWGGDSAFLERILNRQMVGLKTENLKRAFPDPKDSKEPDEWVYGIAQDAEYLGIIDRFEVQLIGEIDKFEKAVNGLIFFCKLFGQSPFKNSNILSDAAECTYDLTPKLPLHNFLGNKERKVKKLLMAIMCFLLETRLIDKNYPDDPGECWQKLCEQKERQLLDQENKRVPKKFDDIFSMTEDKLLKTYYEGLLYRAGGNKTTVAKIAGDIPMGTLIGRLNKVGVQHGRKYQGKNK
jgi:hypothetical protein